MAVEYEWKWGPLRVETVGNSTDIVTGVYWICLARDPAIDETKHGKVTGLFELPFIEESDLVKLDTVTHSTVESWIAAHFDKSTIETESLRVLNTQLNPVSRVVEIPIPTDPNQ